jgi:hypothetical protein
LVKEIKPKRIGKLFLKNSNLSSFYILQIMKIIIWKMEPSENEKDNNN